MEEGAFSGVKQLRKKGINDRKHQEGGRLCCGSCPNSKTGSSARGNREGTGAAQ